MVATEPDVFLYLSIFFGPLDGFIDSTAEDMTGNKMREGPAPPTKLNSTQEPKVFRDTSGGFSAIFMETETRQFSQEDGRSPAVFVSTDTRIFKDIWQICGYITECFSGYMGRLPAMFAVTKSRCFYGFGVYGSMRTLSSLRSQVIDSLEPEPPDLLSTTVTCERTAT